MGNRRSGAWPDSMRDSSSSSWTIWVIESTSISMRPRKCSAAGGSLMAPSRSVSTSALIEASGVRSSCEMLLTKSRRTASSR